MRALHAGVLVCCGALATSCALSKFTMEYDAGTESIGGNSNAGGQGSQGGATAGGVSSMGGSSANGGTTNGGGSAGNGGNTAIGGTFPSGGVSTIGGTTASGGTSALTIGGTAAPTGGTKAATGGSKPTGGMTSIGGITSTGGTTATGGIVATGSTLSAGGTTATGGAIAAGASPTCGTDAGVTPLPPSCPGDTSCCGDPAESCCTTILLDGGGFLMGRSGSVAGTDASSTTSCVPSVYDSPRDYPAGEQPEHYVTVSPFYLDKYEVTVGRMRQFVLDYDRWHGAGYPTAEQGANLHDSEAGSSETGWQSGWPLPADGNAFDASLNCFQNWSTWPMGVDAYAMNCVSWYQAFAFCIWDGGRLPNEAEWEFAAAGGDNNWLYPWGPDPPDCTKAGYGSCGSTPFVAVGSHRGGNSRWGHADLAGSMWEWVLDRYQLDWYSAGGSSCSDCANLSGAEGVLRGGGWNLGAGCLRAAYRLGHDPTNNNGITGGFGFRCARNAPPP